MSRDYHKTPRSERMASVRFKERKCMTCGSPFPSEGAHNRMCDPCRKMSHAMVEGGSTGRKTEPRGFKRYV